MVSELLSIGYKYNTVQEKEQKEVYPPDTNPSTAGVFIALHITLYVHEYSDIRSGGLMDLGSGYGNCWFISGPRGLP